MSYLRNTSEKLGVCPEKAKVAIFFCDLLLFLIVILINSPVNNNFATGILSLVLKKHISSKMSHFVWLFFQNKHIKTILMGNG